MDSRRAFILAIIISLILSFAFSEVRPGPYMERANVTRVLDGDTLEIDSGERVRLIGINAPETGQPCSSEAKAFLESLVLGKEVSMEIAGVGVDDYGRLARYIYIDDVFVNLELVRQGLALAYDYGDVSEYSQDFSKAQSYSREQGLCLWQSSGNSYFLDSCLNVADFHYNADGDDNYNLNDEYVVLENSCDYPVDMEGWTLKDESASRLYTFDRFEIGAGSKVTLHSGSGVNTDVDLYWHHDEGSHRPVWNNDADTIYIRDAEGNLILSEGYS